MAKRGIKSNGPVKELKSTVSDDWNNMKKGWESFQSQRKGGGSVIDSAADAFDSTLKKMGTYKDSSGVTQSSMGKGGAKMAGYALGGMALLDWLFD